MRMPDVWQDLSDDELGDRLLTRGATSELVLLAVRNRESDTWREWITVRLA